MSTYKILLTDTIFPDLSIETLALENTGAEIVLAGDPSPATLIKEGVDCDAVVNVYAQFPAEVISMLDKCKVIVRMGIGVNTIDIDAANKKGIMVGYVPDYCLDEVADHAMALFLAGVRKVCFLNRQVRDGKWNLNAAKPIPRIGGKMFGLLGFGNIARHVAVRAKAFGMEVAAYDPFVPKNIFEDHSVRRFTDFSKFVSQVDFLSLHLPLTDDTKHMINADVLGMMKPGAFIINTSRGPLINEKDLYDALIGGVIAGAGLDVLTTEPPAYPFALAELENVIITPHAAFYSDAAVLDLRRRAFEEAIGTLVNGEPVNWYNRKYFNR